MQRLSSTPPLLLKLGLLLYTPIPLFLFVQVVGNSSERKNMQTIGEAELKRANESLVHNEVGLPDDQRSLNLRSEDDNE